MPLTAAEPLQAPLAVQEVAFAEDHVKVNGCPTKTFVRLAEIVTVGAAGTFTTKFTELEGPPPGEGFATTTASVPAVASSPVLREIVNCVELAKVAVCATPL